MAEKNPEELAQDMGDLEVTELEDEELEDVAGGGNKNCSNTDCCGKPQQR